MYFFSFLIILTKYLTRSNLRRERFLLVYSFKGTFHSLKEKCGDRKQRQVNHTEPLVRKQRKQEVRLGCETSEPALCDLLSPAWLHLLNILQSSKTGPPAGDQCSNTGACGGHFTF